MRKLADMMPPLQLQHYSEVDLHAVFQTPLPSISQLGFSFDVISSSAPHPNLQIDFLKGNHRVGVDIVVTMLCFLALCCFLILSVDRSHLVHHFLVSWYIRVSIG